MSADIGASLPIRIGTRASPLALAQAYETRDRLKAAHDLPDEAIEIVEIITTGDRRLEKKLGDLGGKGLFTKEVEEALVDNRIDLAVHSMKDVPTTLPDGLEIAVVLPREDVRDALVSVRHASIDALPTGAIVGTASLRRQAQTLHRRPDLKVGLFRGNVQTRLSKLEAGEADATYLAMAGLKRLGLTDVATQIIEVEDMLPAVAQGAIGIEIRSRDDATRALLAVLNCTKTATCLHTERTFLATLDGSCRTPIAGLAKLTGDQISFTGEILREDGSEKFETTRIGSFADAERLGADAGEELKARGGPGFFG